MNVKGTLLESIGVIIPIFLIFICFGCDTFTQGLDYGRWREDDARFHNWKETRLEKLNAYIGESKNIIRNDFGDPDQIKTNPYWKDAPYDESWTYKVHENFPLISDGNTLTFYFINDQVADIDIFWL